MTKPPRPSGLARWLLARALPGDVREEILGDLEELFAQRIGRGAPLQARLWYWKEAVAFSARFAWERIRKDGGVASGASGVDTIWKRGRSEAFVSWLDVKLALRILGKYPGLTVVGGLAMAFGIFVSAGTFEFLDGVLDPSLPLPEGDRVVGLRYFDRAKNEVGLTFPHDVRSWKEGLTTVEDIGAFRTLERNLAVNGGIGKPVKVAQISAVAFRVAGIPPLLGRAPTEADDDEGAPPVVLLGYRLWQTRFGGDPAVLGRSVQLGGGRSTVVGVMPEGFGFPVDHEAWTPLGDRARQPGAGQAPPVRAFGRLAPGATLPEARAELAAHAARVAADPSERDEHRRAQLLPYAEFILERPTSFFAQGAIQTFNVFAVLFLILVCGNVALLMFARAATREREMLVRYALGAGRTRIVSQLFVEALVLGTVAAGLGLAAIGPGLRWVHSAIRGVADIWPFWIDATVSPTTVVYGGLLTILAAVVAGGVPALDFTGPRVQARLHQATAGGGGLRMSGIWTGVIVAQIAATMLFVALAYVLHEVAAREGSVNTTFPAEDYVVVRPDMDRERPLRGTAADTVAGDFLERYGAQVHELKRRLIRNADVGGVTVAEDLPGMTHPGAFIELDEGEAPDSRLYRPGHGVTTAAVDIDFFDIFRAPVVEGRSFDSGDLEEEVSVVVVNQAFVDRILGGRNAIGRRIRYARIARRDVAEPGRWHEIVGVVPNLMRDPEPPPIFQNPTTVRVYHPLDPSRAGRYPLHLALQAPDAPERLTPALYRTAGEVSGTLRLHNIQTLDRIKSTEARFWSLWADLVLLVSAVALLLSLAGIYAVMSFTVSRRTREIGVRVALGAKGSRVVVETFNRHLVHLSMGVVIGCGLVVAVVSMMMPVDPTVRHAALLLAYVLGMLGVCSLACILPTVRALRIEPTEALSVEG